MIKRYFPIRLHCWGGLGSQLCAWALYLDLEKSYKSRRIKIYFHSSGVTRRTPEQILFTKTCNVIFRDDFVRIDQSSDILRHSYKNSVGLFKIILEYFGFFSHANTNKDFDNMRKNIIEIRGHYSHRKISDYSLNLILEKFSGNKPAEYLNHHLNDSLMIHYRLGDLLNYDIKSYIKPHHIMELIEAIPKNLSIRKVFVYSDSPKAAESFFTNPNFDFKFMSVDPLDVIRQSLTYKYFIGTNSKISIWIVLLRLHLNDKSYNALPVQLKNDLELLKPNINTNTNFIYY